MELLKEVIKFSKLANKNSLIKELLKAQEEAKEACEKARELYIRYLKEV